MNMAFSRPMWSEIQPHSGRVTPFTMRFNWIARIEAERPQATMTLST